MSLLLSMLPVYLLGNLHCFGMCGPLVMMLSKNRYRVFYFGGRILSFTLAGGLAGALGAVINFIASTYYLPAITSFLFGGVIFFLGLLELFQKSLSFGGVGKKLGEHWGRYSSLLLLQERPFAVFLFGFLTILLPCGQTLIVYSACALAGGIGNGLLNGFTFALLTSPSLVVAMYIEKLFPKALLYSRQIMGGLALFVGTLAILRGLADLEIISHCVLNTRYHIVLY